MKTCTICKEEKDYSQFYKSNNLKASPDGYQYRCKACNKINMSLKKEKYYEYSKKSALKYYYSNKEQLNIKNKQRYESKKDGFYTVYNVVKDNYVGTTTILPYRKYGHKNQLGLDISEYEILGVYSTLEEALVLEDSYHKKGFNGGLSSVERSKLNNFLKL
jgi:hypothetical protein